MAAHPDTPHLDEEDIGDEDSLTEDEDANSASTSSSLPTPTAVAAVATPTSSSAHFVTVALPSAPNGSDLLHSTTVTVASTRPDYQIIALPAAGDRKPFQDDSRKLFQRLWTDEDEIELLRGFFDYTSQRGGTVHWDANLFYDQIRSKLQLEFNKSQLVEKLRRLKKKYRNAVSKINAGKDVGFKSAHDRATFEISSKIWSNIAAPVVNGDNMDEDDEGNLHHVSSSPMRTPNLIPNHNPEVKTEDTTFSSRKRPRLPSQSTPENNVNPISNLAALTEEIVKTNLTQLIKELKSRSHGGGVGGGIGGFASPAPFGFGGSAMLDFGLVTGIEGELKDERWRKQQILELEVYSKRLDLMQDQIRAKLEELRSSNNSRL